MENLSVLFKISGDLIYKKEILKELQMATKKYSKVGVIYGFGTILSQKLKEKGIPFSYVNGIRETTQKGLEVAWEVSEEIRKFLKSNLKEVKLISPVIKLDGKIINTNADELIFKHFKSYDKTIIYTLKGRDKERFKNLERAEIREIS